MCSARGEWGYKVEMACAADHEFRLIKRGKGSR